MENEELLNLYLDKLRAMTEEKLKEKDISVLEALKDALVFLKGELTGY